MITWKIENMERVLSDGFVVIAHWACIANDETSDKSARVYSSCSFEHNPQQENFIPYDQLTEEIVINWVKGILGEETVASYEANAQSQLDLLINPTKEYGVPW